MKLLRHNPQLRQGVRGVSITVFLLIMLPVFLFGTAIAIDISKLVTIYNDNLNIAQAAAEAAVTARDVQTGMLDEAEATRRANALCDKAGVGSCATVSGPDVSIDITMSPFRLYSDSYPLPTGGRILNPDFAQFTAHAEASVCNSYVATGGSDTYCVRPQSPF